MENREKRQSLSLRQSFKSQKKQEKVTNKVV